MEEKVLDANLETEVKRNLMDFYKLHKEECDKKYTDAVDKGCFGIYEEIEDNQVRDIFLIKTEVVILTANVFEKNILHLNAVRAKRQKIYHYIINSSNNPRRPLNINIYFFKMGDFHVLHMEAKQTGSYSMGGSADLVRYVINNEYCFPSAVISYGICFGNDYRTHKIGDTIIADKLYPYFMSAKINEKFLLVKDNNIFQIDAQLEPRIQYLIGKGELSENSNIFYGNMVTGEAVISNSLMKDIFMKAATNQPVLGGEMEGYGLFKECQGFECLIPCMIVKSICDWGVYKNLDDEEVKSIKLKDKLQVYAAEQACKTLMVLLRKDSRILTVSIYEQIKQILLTPQMKEGGIFPLSLLKDMLHNKVKTYKKYGNIDSICGVILDGLMRENIIECIEGEVYRIRR